MGTRLGLNVITAAMAAAALLIGGHAVLTSATENSNVDATLTQCPTNDCEDMLVTHDPEQLALLKAPRNVNYQTRAEVTEPSLRKVEGTTNHEIDTAANNVSNEPKAPDTEQRPIGEQSAP